MTVVTSMKTTTTTTTGRRIPLPHHGYHQCFSDDVCDEVYPLPVVRGVRECPPTALPQRSTLPAHAVPTQHPHKGGELGGWGGWGMALMMLLMMMVLLMVLMMMLLLMMMTKRKKRKKRNNLIRHMKRTKVWNDKSNRKRNFIQGGRFLTVFFSQAWS